MNLKKHFFQSFVESRIGEYLFVALIGGVVYFSIEVLWRGWSHVTMAVCGALCLLFFYYMEEKIEFRRLPLLFKAAAGGIFITAVELLAGIVLNKILKLGIWDYSHMDFNLLGQISI
jgi:hypothetical protein